MPSSAPQPTVLDAPILTSLGQLPNLSEGLVVALGVARDEGAMLRAMGLGEGQRVRVLRRAPGGDPLHVRVGSGGEFAVARPLALLVSVEVAR